MNPTVLLLDASQRSALAAARSLGAKGVPIVAGTTGENDIAGRSRHVSVSIQISDPLTESAIYAESVYSAASSKHASLVLPMTDASTMLLLGSRSDDDDLAIMAPPSGPYGDVSDKENLVSIAVECKIPVPRTIAISGPQDLAAAAREIGLPIIVKPARSKVLDGPGICSTSVRKIDTEEELGSYTENWPLPSGARALVQEFIPGEGAGIFTLFGADGPIAWFAHKRVREKPPAGGVSVLCESVTVDMAMKRASEVLLRRTNWFGPAMVEFKIAPDGTPYLMEINGRFWGSLQLAIDCGVDFPWLFYQMIQGEPVQGPSDYPVGRRLRWLMGDFDRLLLQLRGKGTAEGLSDKLRELARFLNFFERDTRLEVLRRDDLGPFRAELRHWVRSLGGG